MGKPKSFPDGRLWTAVAVTQRREIVRALELHNGETKAAAVELGIERSSLYKLCDRIGFSIKQYRAELRDRTIANAEAEIDNWLDSPDVGGSWLDDVKAEG